jgi:hypothetical protein
MNALNKINVRALIASIFSQTLLFMSGLDHQIMEWCRVGQTLHDSIEETCVAVVHHWISDAVCDFLLHNFIYLLCLNRFKTACFTFCTLFLLLRGRVVFAIAEI